MLCLALLVPWLLAQAFCGDALDAKAAAGKPGEKGVIEDTIREVVIKDTRPRFPGIETWAGKAVRIEGVVSEHGGHSRIILRERGQITLVAGPE